MVGSRPALHVVQTAPHRLSGQHVPAPGQIEHSGPVSPASLHSFLIESHPVVVLLLDLVDALVEILAEIFDVAARIGLSWVVCSVGKWFHSRSVQTCLLQPFWTFLAVVSRSVLVVVVEVHVHVVKGLVLGVVPFGHVLACVSSILVVASSVFSH